MSPLSLGSLLFWSLIGAAAAGLGALVAVRNRAAGRRALGLAGAAAAGMMLGVGYASLTAGIGQAPLWTLIGAMLGVIVVRMLDASPVMSAELAPADVIPPSAREAANASALHSAGEGIAIGAAAAADARFGLFLILTFALHNISEGAMVGTALNGAGWSAMRSTVATLITRLAQPVVAIVAFLAATALPQALPWLLGGSFGALLYLVVGELLPQSYRQSGRTAIALVFSVAAGVVALLGGRTP